MTIYLSRLEQSDLNEINRLANEFYLELGECSDSATRLAKQLNDEEAFGASQILVIKKFVTNQPVGFGFLTELKSTTYPKYGVFDQVFLTTAYRTTFHEEEIQIEAKKLSEKMKFSRIDIATPTDAWYRTVRYFKDKGFRLTAPKFKRAFQMPKAA